MRVTIYHNPRCSKSRATLELLRSRGIEPTVIDYLNNPPATAELERLLTLLGLEPRALMRRREAPYRDNGLDDPTLPRATLVRALHEHPILIERPIVTTGDKARIGRPPEAELEILS